jgi:heme-degrading monooxygenase HmoA
MEKFNNSIVFTNTLATLVLFMMDSILTYTNHVTKINIMTTIENGRSLCTLINVFTVEPENQQKLFEELKEATEKVMSRQPGYISANLHLSDDKKKVTNYAQWKTLDDFKAIMKVDEGIKHMKRAESLCTGFKPVTYNEIWVHGK